MFGHEKITMNGGGGGSAVSATIAAVAAAQPTQSTATTSAPSTPAGAVSAAAAAAAGIPTTTTPTTMAGAANSSASAGISNGMNGATQNANNHRGSDSNKRRKSKNRNTTVPISSTYSRDHLDAWLETCLKDAGSTQLSSSSEFLDYNPSSSFQSNKKTQPQQQTQQQQQLLQQQLHQQQQQQQFQHDFQQQFGTKLRQLNYPAPFSQGFQKSVPTFFKNSLNNRFAFNPNNLLHHTDGSVEFASLPPIVNLLGSENENNSTDVLDGSSSNPNMSRGFRFSDPCLLNPSDNDSKVSGQETPDRRNYTNPTEMENNKFFAALMEQINMLHETNSKICRNLHETKVDIEALKHAPNWGMRHRRDSLSGLSTHSQPLGFGFGTQSPAPTYHSGAYTPGMMTDVVREVKEAARVREDALLSRVKAMVEERSWSMGESNLRMMREIEELKSQIQHLRTDRKDTNKRLTHLETENKYMRQMLASILNNRSSDIIYENETLRTQRKNFQPSDIRQTKRANSLNLHYGVIHQAAEEEEPMNALHIGDQNSIGVTPMESSDHRNSFSSSDGQTSVVNSTSKNGWPDERSLKRIPKPSATAAAEETMELRKELQEAIAARKQADNRIIALENMVKKLQVKLPNGGDERMMGVFGVNNHTMIGGSKNGGGGGIAAAPAYSFLTSSSSTSSSPTPKLKSELSTATTAPTTALISSASSPSQIFQINSSNQMNLAHQLQQQHQIQLQEHQHQQLHHQQQQLQQSQQTHLPPKLSLAGPITDL